MLNYLVEFLGTFILLLTIFKTGKALPIGLALMVAIFMFGDISGGHFNPAVSVAMLMNGSLPLMELLGYVASQVLGGVAACYFNRL